MVYSRKPVGAHAQNITVEIEDGIIKNVEIIGGCNGNNNGIMSLLKGMPAAYVIERFKGTTCGSRPTSCPDQLAITLEEALAQPNA